jgi:hypothetical protein
LLTHRKARLLSHALVIVALAAAVSAPPAHANPWLLAPGDHYYSIGGSYFSADHYYDQGGTLSPLSQRGVHQEEGLVSYNEFGWKANRSFILGIPFVGVTRSVDNSAAGPPRSETGFGNLLVGVRFKLLGGARALSLEGDWIPPLGYNRNLSPALGVGAQSLMWKLAFGAPVGKYGFFQLEGGHRFYLDALAPANQLVAAGDVGVWFGHSLLLMGRYDGTFGENNQGNSYNALIQKTPQGAIWSTSDAVPGTTTNQVTTHLLGPMLVYRVDEHLDLLAGSMYTVSAKNALQVSRYYVAVAVKQTKLGPLQGLLGGARKP